MRNGFAATLALACLSWTAIANADPVVNSTNVGSVAQWAAAPDATASIGDKNYVYLGSTGWNGTESVVLYDNTLEQRHTIDFGNLFGYVGPTTLTVDYRIDILSSNYFNAAFIDQDWTSGSVTQTLLGYSSLADYNNANPLFTLTATDTSIPGPTTIDPTIRQMWFRETISLNTAGGGQLFSASNTVGQSSVPEIDPASTASVLSLVTGALALIERRRRAAT